jgi:quercetin dioxygenase-like cupin family protein
MAESMAQQLVEGEGDAIWFFGTLLTAKVSGEQTGGRYAIVEQIGRSSMATPLHVQHEDEETFYVLEGELTFFTGADAPVRATAGAVVHVPAGAPHAFQVDSDTARWLVVTTPLHEAFFRAAGEPAGARELPPEGPPDLDKLMGLVDEFKIEILGPPPGRAG